MPLLLRWNSTKYRIEDALGDATHRQVVPQSIGSAPDLRTQEHIRPGTRVVVLSCRQGVRPGTIVAMGMVVSAPFTGGLLQRRDPYNIGEDRPHARNNRYVYRQDVTLSFHSIADDRPSQILYGPAIPSASRFVQGSSRSLQHSETSSEVVFLYQRLVVGGATNSAAVASSHHYTIATPALTTSA